MKDRTRFVEVTLTLDTSAYASGDLLADTQLVSNAFRDVGIGAQLESLVVVDEDDQGVAFDVYFFDANVSLGTENSAPSISDVNTRNCLGFVPVATGDYRDLGGARVASVKNIWMALKPETGTQNLYVGVVNGSGAPTFTATGVKLRLGLID